MTQQGIYISPDNIVPNRDRGNHEGLCEKCYNMRNY